MFRPSGTPLTYITLYTNYASRVLNQNNNIIIIPAEIGVDGRGSEAFLAPPHEGTAL